MTTDALHTQLDNVWREVHGEPEAANPVFRGGLGRTKGRGDVAQENEAGTNQNLSESHEEVNEYKKLIN